VAPFSGNIIELCPVGALTSRPYRFRARPWEIEGAGTLCTLCPSQCNVTLTVRDEHVLRVLARQHDEVDDGWLCDKGRFAYQAVHADERVTTPMIRDGGELRAVGWDRALAEAAAGLRRAGAHTAALAGGGASNEEGLLLGRLVREALGSPHLDSPPAGAVALDDWRALSAPALAARVSDLEFAHAVLVLDCEPLDDAPILELRIRKGVRRNRVKLAVASARPSALDDCAAVLRFAPGRGGELAAALAAAVRGEDVDVAAAACGADADALRALAATLVGAGPEVVIVYGERLLAGGGADGLLALARALRLADATGAGLIGIPDAANGRGLREAGVLPNAGPGLADAPLDGGLAAPGIAAALGRGELAAIYLLCVDPVRELPDRPAWEAALARASTVIAHTAFLTDGVREHATVVFPAEAAAEKAGTVTHPDGRVQRLRPAIAHQGQVRAEWSVLAALLARLGAAGTAVPQNVAAASAALFDAVPFYAGLSLESLAGHGLRWPERAEAAALPAPSGVPRVAEDAEGDGRAPLAPGRLALGSYRSIWAAPEVEASPALHFLVRRQVVELGPADAAARGLRHGARVQVIGDAGTRVEAQVALRGAIPAGVAFLERGIAGDGANALRGGSVEILAAREPEGEPEPVGAGVGATGGGGSATVAGGAVVEGSSEALE
jgi:NADH-quinone oxidoreductase subunit G